MGPARKCDRGKCCGTEFDIVESLVDFLVDLVTMGMRSSLEQRLSWSCGLIDDWLDKITMERSRNLPPPVRLLQG